MNWNVSLGRAIAACAVGILVSGAQANAQTRQPHSCQELLEPGLSPAVDGPRKIYTLDDAHQYDVYCKDMAQDAKDYLILKRTGPGFNYSQYTVRPDFPTKNRGDTVVTYYTAVRFDPYTMLVDIGDPTFATTTGGPAQQSQSGTWTDTVTITRLPYAVAADCAGARWNTGFANIDLTGTPFAVDSDFTSRGLQADGVVNGVAACPPNDCGYKYVHVVSKVVDIWGGGTCGAAGPVGMGANFYSWIKAPAPATSFALKLKIQPN